MCLHEAMNLSNGGALGTRNCHLLAYQVITASVEIFECGEDFRQMGFRRLEELGNAFERREGQKHIGSSLSRFP